jgi:DNA helicase-2/ATP-dependent DNA helicase PcrA
MNPSSYQSNVIEAVKNGKGNILIQAVAGSGKTTLLLMITKHISKAIALMFNRKIYIELEAKLIKNGIQSTIAKTVHSAGYGAFRKRFGYGVLLNADKVRDIIVSQYPETQVSIYGSFVSKLVQLAKDSGFGLGGQFPAIANTQAWQNLIEHHDLSLDYDDASFEVAIQMAQNCLAISNRDLKTVDYQDMVYLPLLTNTVLPKFDWILVDECQDLSPLRIAMIKAMLPIHGRVVVVGDRQQAIYGFTGADSEAMETIKAEFNAQEFPLSVCYRCSKSVIRHVKNIVPSSPIEAWDQSPEGSVSSIEYKEFLNLKNTLTGADAILCRNNSPLVKTAFKLIANGIGCRIEGRDIGVSLIKLVKRWKVKTLNSLSDRLTTYLDRETQKLRSKGKDSAAGLLEDRVECLRTLITKCQSDGKHSLRELETLILGMFTDGENNPNKNLVTLCSSHKSKGLEWDRVFLLDRQAYMPSPWATRDWMLVQESNLVYVSLTRAKRDLVEVTGVKDFLKNGE